VLIASQPTRGLDVGSIEFVHRRIVEQRDHGVAVLIVSSELDEIYALADRIAVMYEGKITGFRDPEVPAAELGRLMAGGADTEPEPELEAAPGPATTAAAESGPGPTTVFDPAFGAGPEPGPPPEATAPQEEI
jgi:ABC-type multidrug transport system ATPase subunit